jgi:hypothetical protein
MTEVDVEYDEGREAHEKNHPPFLENDRLAFGCSEDLKDRLSRSDALVARVGLRHTRSIGFGSHETMTTYKAGIAIPPREMRSMQS